MPCSHLYGRLNASRGPLYPTTQQLVADLYKLICVSAAQESIETDGPGGVDARLVLIAYPQDGQLPEAPAVSATKQELEGPAIDLYTLARHRTPWDTVYSTQCEQGETILNQYLSVSKPPKRISRIPGSPPSIDNTKSPNATSEAPVNSVDHLSVAVGGTFDHLHIGHKLLLTMFAFTIGRSGTGSTNSSRILTVGITGDSMLKNKKYADELESWKCRQASVQRFLSSLVYYGLDDDDGDVDVKEVNEPGPNGHALHVRYPSGLVIRYVEIWDPFGPTITDKDISALVLSLETRGGGAAVNDKRKEQGWDALEVFEVAVLVASEEGSVDETFQSKLSSTEIRRKRSERVQ